MNMKKLSGEIIKIARNPANQVVFITIKTNVKSSKNLTLGDINIKQEDSHAKK